MKISLKKISEEKFEVKITDGEEVIFNDIRYFMYMGEEVINTQTSLDTINQLSTLFGEFTEIENDFNI
jgi:hypothetical protein